MPSLVGPVLSSGQISNSVQPVLHADGLLLRAWKVEDAAAVVAAYADPDIERWHVRSMTSIEATEWIRAAEAAWREERAASWAIEAPEAVVGRMTLKLRLSHGLAEAAYWTLPTARGRGVASLALRTATHWAFDIGLHRVELEHSTQNLPSCRVAGKAGFSVEGTRRSAGWHGDGWHDMHLHGRVNHGGDPSVTSPFAADPCDSPWSGARVTSGRGKADPNRQPECWMRPSLANRP